MAKDEQVEIVVEYEKKKSYFLVPKDKLRVASDWFDTSVSWKLQQGADEELDGDESTAEFEEFLLPADHTEPATFSTFVEWLSLGTIEKPSAESFREVVEAQEANFIEEAKAQREERERKIGEFDRARRKKLRSEWQRCRIEWCFEKVVKVNHCFNEFLQRKALRRTQCLCDSQRAAADEQQCYILGEHLRAHSFTNTAMDHFISLTEIFWKCYKKLLPISENFHTLAYIWGNTLPMSPLRGIVLRHFNVLSRVDTLWYEIFRGMSDDFMKEFGEEAREAAKEYREAEPTATWEIISCVYHRQPKQRKGTEQKACCLY